jgi:hypothetical protein
VDRDWFIIPLNEIEFQRCNSFSDTLVIHRKKRLRGIFRKTLRDGGEFPCFMAKRFFLFISVAHVTQE